MVQEKLTAVKDTRLCSSVRLGFLGIRPQVSSFALSLQSIYYLGTWTLIP